MFHIFLSELMSKAMFLLQHNVNNRLIVFRNSLYFFFRFSLNNIVLISCVNRKPTSCTNQYSCHAEVQWWSFSDMLLMALTPSSLEYIRLNSFELKTKFSKIDSVLTILIVTRSILRARYSTAVWLLPYIKNHVIFTGRFISCSCLNQWYFHKKSSRKNTTIFTSSLGAVVGHRVHNLYAWLNRQDFHNRP